MQLIVLYLRIHQYRSCQPPYENLLGAHILAKKHKSALVSVCNSCHGKNSLDRINNLMMGMTIQVSTNKEENYDDNGDDGDDDDENDSDDGRSMEFETPLCPINNRPSFMTSSMSSSSSSSSSSMSSSSPYSLLIIISRSCIDCMI